MTHKISQLDEQDDCEVNRSDSEKNLCLLWSEGSCNCGKCEKCDYYAREEGFNFHFGIVWINDHMKSLNRNLDSAQYFYHLQKWGKRYGCSERRKTYQKISRNSSSFLQKVRQEFKKKLLHCKRPRLFVCLVFWPSRPFTIYIFLYYIWER